MSTFILLPFFASILPIIFLIFNIGTKSKKTLFLEFFILLIIFTSGFFLQYYFGKFYNEFYSSPEITTNTGKTYTIAKYESSNKNKNESSIENKIYIDRSYVLNDPLDNIDFFDSIKKPS